MNATRHAALSVVPVLPGVERAEAWEAHRDATIASLAPLGYLETVLADRVASLLWRLGRVTRYETENTASKLETVEEDLSDDLENRQRFSFLRSPIGPAEGRPVLETTKAEIRDELEARTETAKGFLYLRDLGDEDPFPPEHAEGVLIAVARKVDVEPADVELPFLPPEADELGWSKWTGWTRKLVLSVAEAIVASSRWEEYRSEGADRIWRTCGAAAEVDVRMAAQSLRDVEAELQRKVRSRVLLSAEGLEKVARYETHLERSLYKALHELQRLQAARTGAGVAPLALDEDVSVGPVRSRPEVLDVDGELVEP